MERMKVRDLNGGVGVVVAWCMYSENMRLVTKNSGMVLLTGITNV